MLSLGTLRHCPCRTVALSPKRSEAPARARGRQGPQGREASVSRNGARWLEHHCVAAWCRLGRISLLRYMRSIA